MTTVLPQKRSTRGPIWRTRREDATKAPLAWTDAHHLLAWYHDGDTNINNLISACRHHHMRLHEDGWTAHLDPTTGEVWITRPDGTPYDLGPSHPWRPNGTDTLPADGTGGLVDRGLSGE